MLLHISTVKENSVVAITWRKTDNVSQCVKTVPGYQLYHKEFQISLHVQSKQSGKKKKREMHMGPEHIDFRKKTRGFS